MLNEKHNNSSNWRSKLEELTVLPGETVLEKNAAWDKLDGRLRKDPRKHKAIWWLAAACMLPAFIITLLIADKKENILVKNKPQQIQTKTVPVPDLQVTYTEPVAVITPIDKQQIVNDHKKNKKPEAIITAPKENDPATAVAASPAVTEPEEKLYTIPETDTIVAAAPAMAVKKKLPVVHINELEVSPAQVSNYVQRSVRIKFGNNKSANQTITAKQQYTDGFKINLSLKN